MKISKAMLEAYIGGITNHWIIEHGIPPETSEHYAPYMEELKKTLIELDDINAFQIGIDFLLKHPEMDIAFLNGSEYAWEDVEIRPLLVYIRENLWSDLNLEGVDVELVDIPISEWRSL
jgi:hypothetical protein